MEVRENEIGIEEVGSVLKKTELFLSRLIFLSRHLIEDHAADMCVLVYHANRVGITVPPYIEEEIEKYLLKDLDSNYRKLPYRNTMWGTSYLLSRGYELERLSKVIEHAFSLQNEYGGIGSYEGDVGRIPNTSMLMSAILSKDHVHTPIFKTYETRILKACNFLVHEWKKDASVGNALAYKGAHVTETLLKCLDLNLKMENITDALKYTVGIVLDMQLKNGAWTFLAQKSTKRIGIELAVPNITAIVMVPLCELYIREKKGNKITLDEKLSETVFTAIKEGTKYLCETQTELGFWYAHSSEELSFITGRCALALKKGLEVLRNEH